MGRAVDPDKIQISSPAELTLEFTHLVQALNKDETEHTWEQIDKAIKRFHAVVRGGACKFTPEFVKAIKEKEVVLGIVRSIATERTRLSATALDLIASCTRLSTAFFPLLSSYLPILLRLLSRTNKLYISRAQATLSSIVRNTHLGPEMIKYVVNEWKNDGGKSATFRIGATELFAEILHHANEEQKGNDREREGSSTGVNTDSRGREMESLEKRMDEVEWIIKSAATDREVKVRATAKDAWEVYKTTWPSRVPQFTAPMTPVIRRYLNIPALNGTGQGALATTKPRVPSVLKNTTSASTRPAAPPAHPSVSLPPTQLIHATQRPTAPRATSRDPSKTTTEDPKKTTSLSSSVGASSRPRAQPSTGSSLSKSVGPSRPHPSTVEAPPPLPTASASSSNSTSWSESCPPSDPVPTLPLPNASSARPAHSFRPGPARNISSSLQVNPGQPRLRAGRIVAGPPPPLPQAPSTATRVVGTLTSTAPALAKTVRTLPARPPPPQPSSSALSTARPFVSTLNASAPLRPASSSAPFRPQQPSSRPPRPPVTAATHASQARSKSPETTRKVMSPEVSKATLMARQRREAREREAEEILKVAKATPLPDTGDNDEDEAEDESQEVAEDVAEDEGGVGDVAFVEGSTTISSSHSTSTLTLPAQSVPEHTGVIPLPSLLEAQLQDLDVTLDISAVGLNSEKGDEKEAQRVLDGLLEEQEATGDEEESEESMVVINRSEMTIRLVDDFIDMAAQEKRVEIASEIAVMEVMDEEEESVEEEGATEEGNVRSPTPTEIATLASPFIPEPVEERSDPSVALSFDDQVSTERISLQQTAEYDTISDPDLSIRKGVVESKLDSEDVGGVERMSREALITADLPTPSPALEDVLEDALAPSIPDTFTSSSEVFHDPPSLFHLTPLRSATPLEVDQEDNFEQESAQTCSIIMETPPKMDHVIRIAIPGHYRQGPVEGPFGETQDHHLLPDEGDDLDDDNIEESFDVRMSALDQDREAQEGRTFFIPLNDAVAEDDSDQDDYGLSHAVDPEANTVIIHRSNPFIDDSSEDEEDDADNDLREVFEVNQVALRFEDEDGPSFEDRDLSSIDQITSTAEFDQIPAPSILRRFSSPPKRAEDDPEILDAEDVPVFKRSLRNRTIVTPGTPGGITLRKSYHGKVGKILGEVGN